MVAAQYMILASQALREALVKSKQSDFPLGKWQVWARRFEEIADERDLDLEANAAVKEALEKMGSFDSSKPDS